MFARRTFIYNSVAFYYNHFITDDKKIAEESVLKADELKKRKEINKSNRTAVQAYLQLYSFTLLSLSQ